MRKKFVVPDLAILIIASSVLLVIVFLWAYSGTPRDSWVSPDGQHRLVFFETISLPHLALPGHGGGFKYHGYFELTDYNGETSGKVFVNERVPERMEPHWLKDNVVFLNCQGISYKTANGKSLK